MQSRSIRRSGQPTCASAWSNACFGSGPDPRRALWPAALCAALKGRTHGCTDQCCKREESSCQLGAVHTWHLADIPLTPPNVRFRGESGHDEAQISALAVAIGGKADMSLCTANVRLWPKADISVSGISGLFLWALAPFDPPC